MAQQNGNGSKTVYKFIGKKSEKKSNRRWSLTVYSVFPFSPPNTTNIYKQLESSTTRSYNILVHIFKHCYIRFYGNQE